MEKTQIKFRCGHTLRQMLDKFDISIASVQDQLNQDDLSEDGSYNICGNIIMIRYPTVQLRPDSPQVASEGGQCQQIVIRRSFFFFALAQSLILWTSQGGWHE